MRYLQDIFTTLWTIWNHRNMVIHEGKQPNPIKVILTAQNLSYGYQTNLSKAQHPYKQRLNHNYMHPCVGRNWQILIKIAGTKRKKANRCAYAYEARNLQGHIIFIGAISCATKTAFGATQEAITKARNLGYQIILVLCNNTRLVRVTNLERAPHWQEQTMVTNLQSLQQSGPFYRLIFVPNFVLGHVCYLANQATKMPIYYFWSPMIHNVNTNSM